MSELLSMFGSYDFAVRNALVLCLVALAVYVLLSAGIFAVPQVGLMAVGAYVSAILSVDLGMAFPLALGGGMLMALLVGLLLAGILARLNGIYLAIASIAFSEIVRVAVLNLPLTGGATGKIGIPREASDTWVLGCVAAAAVGLVLLRRSRAGLSIAAMRVDPLMAQHQGVNTVRTRVLLFGLSGLLAGTAGALQVHMSGFVEPSQFNFELLIELLAVVVVGGLAYVGGTFLGAVVIFGMPYTLEGLGEWQAVANGVIIVATVAFAPGGIVGTIHRALLATRHGLSEVGGAKSPSDELVPSTQPEGSVAGVTVLDATEITVDFGGVRALDSATIGARSGEVLGIVGPNGSGKTTLLNALSGAYRPSSGGGHIGGRDLTRLWGRPHLLAGSGVARTFQTILLMDTASATTNVALGVPWRQRRHRTRIARQLLDRLGLAAIADTPTAKLPYGVRRQVEIARALAHRPSLLLLDEPTAGMSQEEREEVFRVVSGARSEGVAVILVEHDVAMMRRFCDRLVVLDLGRVLATGAPEKVLASKEVVDAYIGSGALT